MRGSTAPAVGLVGAPAACRPPPEPPWRASTATTIAATIATTAVPAMTSRVAAGRKERWWGRRIGALLSQD
jgi:hypothetical protein